MLDVRYVYPNRAVMSVEKHDPVALQRGRPAGAPQFDSAAPRLRDAPGGLTELESTPSTLLPPADVGYPGLRKWLLPVVGFAGLTAVGWLAHHRLNSDAAEPRMIEVRAITPAESPRSVDETKASSVGASADVSRAQQTGASAATQQVSDLSGQVKLSTNDWARLWRERNVSAYRALYDESAPGMVEHLSTRTGRISRARFIEVELRDPVFTQTAPGEITVRFRQVYRSDSFRSEDRKELVWRQTPMGPRITAERAIP